MNQTLSNVENKMPVKTITSGNLRLLDKPFPHETTIDGSISHGVQKLWHRFYPHFNSEAFGDLLRQKIRATDHVLEIGAGSGKGNQKHFELRGKVARYMGIDPDARVLENQYLDDARVGKAESLPLANESFDLVFHTFVAEHFQSPQTCNREIARVLKPGGLLLFQTPSRYYYASLVAQITPQWFHEFYVSHFGSGRVSEEIFPTYYRLNEKRSITEQLHDCGFECQIQHLSTPPGYLRFSKLSFLVGVLFERTLERSFPALRARLIVEARKIT